MEQQEFPYSWARDLPPSFSQEVVDAVRDKFSKVYHIRRENQLEIQNTVQLTDSFRNLFCYIALSDKILAIDSFTQHVAAAFNKKATVGWTSNSPVVFGHEIHDNIIASVDESFRHRIDSYLEKDDWTGGRFHECPYDNIGSIFNKEEFVNSILGIQTPSKFFNIAEQPTIMF
jgi:hypothetical protein